MMKKCLLILISILLVLVGCGKQEPSIIFPYPNLQWGMSQNEVIKTLGGNAKKLDTSFLEETLGKVPDLFKYSVEYSETNPNGEKGLTMSVDCTCPENQLSLVIINYEFAKDNVQLYISKFNELYDYLYDTYGAPTNTTGELEAENIYVVTWELGTDEIELSFNDMLNSLSISPTKVSLTFNHSTTE